MPGPLRAGSLLIALLLASFPLLSKFSSAAAAPAQKFTASQRILLFPKDCSVGQVYLVKGVNSTLLCEASGLVRVPAGRRVRLKIDRKHARKIQRLEELAVDAFDELDLTRAEIDPEDLTLIKRFSRLKVLILKQNPGLSGHLREIFSMPAVQDLNLSSMNLHDADIAGIEKMKSLRKLTLDMNAVGDRGLAYISGLTQLQKLMLGRSKVSSSGIALLKQQCLETVSFSGLDIEGALAAFLSKNNGLRYLDISNTNCSASDLLALGQAVHLNTVLAANIKGISRGFISSLVGMKELKKLNLSGTALSEDMLDKGAFLKNLCELEVANTEIGDRFMARLKDCAELQALDLSQTKVSDKGLAYLSGLKSLSRLDLSACKLTDKAAGNISQLTALKNLNLSRTQLGDNSMSAVEKLKNLNNLNLSGSRISSGSIASLCKLKALQELDLTLCRLDSRDILKLKRALPACKILHDFN